MLYCHYPLSESGMLYIASTNNKQARMWLSPPARPPPPQAASSQGTQILLADVSWNCSERQISELYKRRERCVCVCVCEMILQPGHPCPPIPRHHQDSFTIKMFLDVLFVSNVSTSKCYEEEKQNAERTRGPIHLGPLCHLQWRARGSTQRPHCCPCPGKQQHKACKWWGSHYWVGGDESKTQKHWNVLNTSPDTMCCW